jgi:hypothetical protein
VVPVDPAAMQGAPVAAPDMQEPAPPKYHDIVVVRAKTYAQAKVDPVPPEEFGISRMARSLRDCDYCFHKVIVPINKLMAQGYDTDQLQTLPTYTGITNIEELSRDTINEERFQGDKLNTTARMVEVTEHYVRMDYKGDGKPCLYKVTTAGSQGEILTKNGELDIEEIDAMPFAAMTPVIVTHRFFGRSIADLVMDIQRIKTALLRGALDNLYLHNNPRVEVAETFASPETLDDLLVSRPGGIVRTKQPGGLNWQVVPDITASVYPALQYMDATREWRTGVSRQGQGLDANALQNQTATAANQLFTAAQARMKLIARIFAETGIRDLFALLHATIRKHGQQVQTVRLRNQWVTVDPREWKTRNDMTIHVGLGTGGKEQQLVHLMSLIAAQEKGIAAGLVTPRNLYNSAKELVKLSGFKSVEQFFRDPSQPPDPNDPTSAPIQQPPDPKLIELQAKNEIEKTQAQADIATQTAKTQAEMALAQQKAALDAQILREQHAARMEEHRMTMATKLMSVATDGQQTGPDMNVIHSILDRLHPQPRGMRVVRDAQGRVSHTEPI